MSTQRSGLTQQLAQWASGALSQPLPAAAVEQVRNGFIDTVAVMIAGRDQPVVEHLREFVSRRGVQPGPAQILWRESGFAVADAALINATAAHALDYDDVALQGHPSAVLVPALLAEGQRLGSSGAELMRAYQVGYETWAELIGRDSDLHHLKGWHPTAVFGVVAVAAAVVALRRSPSSLAAHALGLAATQACGLVANFGAMAKPMHAGLAAAHGIEAVDMAEAGLTAAPDALEHHSGFLAALSPAGKVDRERAMPNIDAHPQFLKLGLSIKKYPMCFATHRLIDAALDLARQHEISATDVEALQATIGPAQASMLRNHRPQTGLEAKFSLEFALAAALVARQVGLAQLHDEFVQQAEVQNLLPKVSIEVEDSVNPHEPSLAEADTLQIRLKNGQTFESGRIQHARGTPHAPLREGELRTKFDDCLREGGEGEGDALWSQLQNLHHVDDIRELMASAHS